MIDLQEEKDEKFSLQVVVLVLLCVELLIYVIKENHWSFVLDFKLNSTFCQAQPQVKVNFNFN